MQKSINHQFRSVLVVFKNIHGFIHSLCYRPNVIVQHKLICFSVAFLEFTMAVLYVHCSFKGQKYPFAALFRIMECISDYLVFKIMTTRIIYPNDINAFITK